MMADQTVEGLMEQARALGDDIDAHRRKASQIAVQRRRLFLALNREHGVSFKRLARDLGFADSFVVNQVGKACEEAGIPRRRARTESG